MVKKKTSFNGVKISQSTDTKINCYSTTVFSEL